MIIIMVIVGLIVAFKVFNLREHLTLVYVNAGKELRKIESLSGILSLTLIFSFVLLGLFPIVTKKLLEFHKRSQGLVTVGNK